MVAHRYLPHLGGVERHVESLSLELLRRGHEVSILTECYDPSLPLQENVNGISVYRYGAARGVLRNLFLAPFVYLDRSKKYRRLFAQADIVHCHDWLPFFKFLMSFRMVFPSKPFFITFHGWSGRFPPSRSEVFVHRVCTALTRGNICVGAFIAQWYRFSPGTVIYGAADLEREVEERVPPSDLLYVGRLEPDTGIREVVLAWELLQRESTTPLRAVICGDGSLRDEIEAAVRRIGIECAMHGMVGNVHAYLASARAVFVNSYLAIIEALQAGKPVFAVYHNELKKDYLTMMPGSGTYFAVASSPEALADAVREFWRGGRTPGHAAGHEWALRQTWGSVADAYESLWVSQPIKVHSA